MMTCTVSAGRCARSLRVQVPPHAGLTALGVLNASRGPPASAHGWGRTPPGPRRGSWSRPSAPPCPSPTAPARAAPGGSGRRPAARARTARPRSRPRSLRRPSLPRCGGADGRWASPPPAAPCRSRSCTIRAAARSLDGAPAGSSYRRPGISARAARRGIERPAGCVRSTTEATAPSAFIQPIARTRWGPGNIPTGTSFRHSGKPSKRRRPGVSRSPAAVATAFQRSDYSGRKLQPLPLATLLGRVPAQQPGSRTERPERPTLREPSHSHPQRAQPPRCASRAATSSCTKTWANRSSGWNDWARASPSRTSSAFTKTPSANT